MKPIKGSSVDLEVPFLAVKDLETSKKFYTFLFDQSVMIDLGDNVTFDGGFTIKEDFKGLMDLSLDFVHFGTSDSELYFETDDLDGFLKKIDSYGDVEVIHIMKAHEWGQRIVRLYDPDKHIIEVEEEMSVVARQIYLKCNSAEETAKIMDLSVEVVIRWVKDQT